MGYWITDWLEALHNWLAQASYKQDMDFKTLSWGMQGASAEVAQAARLESETEGVATGSRSPFLGRAHRSARVSAMSSAAPAWRRCKTCSTGSCASSSSWRRSGPSPI